MYDRGFGRGASTAAEGFLPRSWARPERRAVDGGLLDKRHLWDLKRATGYELHWSVLSVSSILSILSILSVKPWHTDRWTASRPGRREKSVLLHFLLHLHPCTNSLDYIAQALGSFPDTKSNTKSVSVHERGASLEDETRADESKRTSRTRPQGLLPHRPPPLCR